MAESSSSRKRSYFEGVDDFDDLQNPRKPTEKKKVRFPKGKKQKPGDEAVDPNSQAEEEAGESEEAKLVARARELRRKRKVVEGTEMLHDISVAEKRYEDNETFIDDGIKVEPFNLDQEREEGYFDQSGNFVEYINQEIKDAWLDSVEVDPKLADKVFVEIIDGLGNAELSAPEIGMMKRRMADVLEPGETVLGALRRLKGTSSGKKEKMSAETKIIFDQLTEDAMKLMENGDYNVYEERQEVFQREAEGYERLAKARAGGVVVNPEQEQQQQEQDAFDMFADDDENAHPNPAPENNDVVPGPNGNSISQPSESGTLQNDYVYDESSGYYYSSSLGYYYDPSSGLYCSAASGLWYAYDADKMTYVEVQETASASS